MTPAKSIGGKLHGSGTRLGPQDGYTLWEGPDNVSTAAVALAIGAGGALNPMETTVPLAVDETLDALRRFSRSDTDHQGRDIASSGHVGRRSRVRV